MKTVYLVASGDLRLSANQNCWPAQEAMEQQVMAAVERQGWRVKRAHAYNPEAKHGFLDSQKHGMEAFRSIPPSAPLIVAEAVWQYSHHVLPGLMTHRGPILTVANWSGQWPGLVGMLNLNGSLTKAGIKYSTLWSENFEDAFFVKGLSSWLKTGKAPHDTSHVQAYAGVKIPARIHVDEVGVLFIGSSDIVPHIPNVQISENRNGQAHRASESFGCMGNLYHPLLGRQLNYFCAPGGFQFLFTDLMVSAD